MPYSCTLDATDLVLGSLRVISKGCSKLSEDDCVELLWPAELLLSVELNACYYSFESISSSFMSDIKLFLIYLMPDLLLDRRRLPFFFELLLEVIVELRYSSQVLPLLNEQFLSGDTLSNTFLQEGLTFSSCC